MPSPLETVTAWFDAHGRGDVAGARGLVADDLVMRVTGRPEISGEFHGFDAFMRWYADRTAVLGPTTYRVADLLGSADSAAAVLVISDGATEWDQVALYSVAGGRIGRIRVFEEPGSPCRPTAA